MKIALSSMLLAAGLLLLSPSSRAQADDAATQAAASAALAAKYCPVFPAGAALEWDYYQGPDFEVCYAIEPTGKRQAFGVYLGGHPSFHPERATRIGPGRIAGRRVTWYRQEADDMPPDALGQQALLEMPNGSLVHVWVSAATPAELQPRLAVLADLRFQR